MTQVCSLPSSTADVNEMYNHKRLPKGIHIVGADKESVPEVREISPNEGRYESDNHEKSVGKKADNLNRPDAESILEKKKQEAPWGYIFIRHMSTGSFEKRLESLKRNYSAASA